MPPRDRTTKSLPLSQELVEYYRQRLEEIDDEKALMIKKIDECDAHHKEMHELRWELRKKMNEIQDLQKALSDAHAYVYDERQQLLQVYADADSVKIENLELHQRNQQLLALTQPVHDELTYFPGRHPEKMRRYPAEQTDLADEAPLGSSTWAGGSGGGKAARKRRVSSPARPGSPSARPASTGGAAGPGERRASISGLARGPSKRVIRTVYMPNEQNDALLTTIESLRAQLEEQKQLHRQQVEGLKEDRRRRMEEERVRALHDREKLESAEKGLEHSQELLRENTKEYLTYRYNTQLTQRLMKEDSETLLSQVKALATQLDATQRKAAAEIKIAEQNAQLMTEEATNQFRQQAMEREEEHRNLKELYERSVQMYEEDKRKLKEQVSRQSRKYKELEDQRKLEREGYLTEIRQLRERLRGLEVAVYRPAADGDQSSYELELLNAALATAGRAKGLTGEMNRLKARVSGMEHDVVNLRA